MSTTHRIGPYRITINVGPAAFLVLIVLATLVVVFFARPETAELVLTPTGILALIAQGIMRQAFTVERHEPEEGAKPDA